MFDLKRKKKHQRPLGNMTHFKILESTNASSVWTTSSKIFDQEWLFKEIICVY
jgi:hypothetical protein